MRRRHVERILCRVRVAIAALVATGELGARDDWGSESKERIEFVIHRSGRACCWVTFRNEKETKEKTLSGRRATAVGDELVSRLVEAVQTRGSQRIQYLSRGELSSRWMKLPRGRAGDSGGGEKSPGKNPAVIRWL